MASGAVCRAPATNMYFAPNGQVNACCGNRTHSLGRWPEKSLRQIWNGKPIQDLRSHLEDGDFSRGCNVCRQLIESGNAQGALSSKFDTIENNNSDGYPSLLELELANTCNLECIMCQGAHSSAIQKNRDGLSPEKNPYDGRFVEELEEFLPHLKRMDFFGGEPFLVDIYYDIWERVIHKRPETIIHVQTNGTIFNSRVKRLLEKGRFKISLSLDALDEKRYEAIRRKAHFSKTMENLEAFQALGLERGTGFGISACPMSVNWREIPKIVCFCNDRGIPLYFNTVWSPINLSVWAQPGWVLAELAQSLEELEFAGDTPAGCANKAAVLSLLNQVRAWAASASDRERIEKKLPKPGRARREALKGLIMERLHDFSCRCTQPDWRRRIDWVLDRRWPDLGRLEAAEAFWRYLFELGPELLFFELGILGDWDPEETGRRFRESLGIAVAGQVQGLEYRR